MEKLLANGYKQGFDNIDFKYAFKRLKEEIKELEEEMICLNQGLNNYETIRHEAADVANFAHMIIMGCDKEIKK